jgi:hypothetical protein
MIRSRWACSAVRSSGRSRPYAPRLRVTSSPRRRIRVISWLSKPWIRSDLVRKMSSMRASAPQWMKPPTEGLENLWITAQHDSDQRHRRIAYPERTSR